MSGRALLCGKAAEHLVKLLGLLGGDHDGERANAGRMADDFVRQFGLRWADVIYGAPEWQQMAKS